MAKVAKVKPELAAGISDSGTSRANMLGPTKRSLV